MNDIDMWNRFIKEVCGAFHKDNSDSFSQIQKNAIIALYYDAEVNNGGHTLFFDCFGDVFSNEEVAAALREIGGEAFASNFLSAAAHIHYTEEMGYMDDDEDAEQDPIEDDIYYDRQPRLPELLEIYIRDHKEQIFS